MLAAAQGARVSSPWRNGLDGRTTPANNRVMTKEELIQKLNDLTDAEYATVAPFLEADLESADDLEALRKEVEAGRQSASTDPILEAVDVYARVRKSLSE